MTSGKVKEIRDAYGFIAGDDGKDYFMHRSDLVTPTRFDDLNEGDRVEFEVVVPAPAKGPRASNVRRITATEGAS